MQLSEAIEALAIATRARGKSPRTIKSYREKLGYLLAFLGDVDVGDISTSDLRGYMAHMYDRGLSPFTISTRGGAMRRLFNWLEAEELIDNNPASKVEIPKPRRQEPKGLSSDDVLALLTACAGDEPMELRDRAAICLLFDSGARAGGICSLRVDKLDLDRGLALATEKGGKVRHLMFGPATAEALRAWLDVRPEGNKAVFVALGGRQPGRPMSPDSLWQMVQRRAKQAGIEGPVSVHGFRHSFAREYLMSGGDLGALAQTLGHSDVRTTVDYYAVFAVGQLKELHRRHSPMAKLFSDGKED
jgi:site-specific recombinase XerD